MSGWNQEAYLSPEQSIWLLACGPITLDNFDGWERREARRRFQARWPRTLANKEHWRASRYDIRRGLRVAHARLMRECQWDGAMLFLRAAGRFQREVMLGNIEVVGTNELTHEPGVIPHLNFGSLEWDVINARLCPPDWTERNRFWRGVGCRTADLLKMLRSEAAAECHAPAEAPVDMSKAASAAIHRAISDVYDDYERRREKAPNIIEIIKPVQALLKERGKTASGKRIRELAGDKQHKVRRGEIGRRRPKSHL